ncbi:MAG: hypothetical protein AAF530_21220 [Pseudomonadota bacterium]
MVELLLRAQQKLDTRIAQGKTLVPDQPVEYDAFADLTMVPRPGFIEHIRNGHITAHRSDLKAFTETELVLQDGDVLPVDCVVLGRGWNTGFEFLNDDLRADLGDGPDGFYLYRHILHPKAPNLAFVGRASSFMSATTFALQARWLAKVAAGSVCLPPAEDMSAEIDALKRWKRSWMPPGPARSAPLLLHIAHYHDELIRDMGGEPPRKRGVLAPLKELLVQYQASDFHEVV